MGSDEALLREIDSCVNDWSKKCGQALANGEIDDYYLQKNQVLFFYGSCCVKLLQGCVYSDIHHPRVASPDHG